jgi:hypothetical protein
MCSNSLLDLARGTPLGPAHEVADRDVRRDFGEHMHIIARQGTVDDDQAQFVVHLPNDLSRLQADLALQHIETVVGSPDMMIAMMKCGVATTFVGY